MATSRPAFVATLLSYQHVLRTALARLNALRSHRAANNTASNAAQSLEGDIAVTRKNLLLVDGEVRRLVEQAGGSIADGDTAALRRLLLATDSSSASDDKKAPPHSAARPPSNDAPSSSAASVSSPLPRGPLPSSSLQYHLPEALLHVASFADCSGLGALLLTCRDAAALLSEVGDEGRRRRGRGRRGGEVGQEATLRVEGPKKRGGECGAREVADGKLSSVSGSSPLRLPVSVLAGAADRAVADRFKASLLPYCDGHDHGFQDGTTRAHGDDDALRQRQSQRRCHLDRRHSEGRRLESGDGEQRTLTDISKKKMFHVSCGVSCISKLQPRRVDPAGFRCSLVAYQIQNEKINRCTAYPFRNRIISASVFGISS